MPVTRDHVQVSLRLAPRVPWPAMAFATAFVVFARAAESTGRLPFAAVAVAAALAGAIDDEARATMAASPTSLLSRRLARSLLLVVLAALWWAALLWFTALRSPGSVMVKGRSLEATALAALALAVSAFAHRWSVDGKGAPAGAAAAAVSFASIQLIHYSWWPLRPPGTPGANPRIAVLLLCAVAAFTAQSKDPASVRGALSEARRRWRPAGAGRRTRSA